MAFIRCRPILSRNSTLPLLQRCLVTRSPSAPLRATRSFGNNSDGKLRSSRSADRIQFLGRKEQRAAFSVSQQRPSAAAATSSDPELVAVNVNGQTSPFHAVFLRDACPCPSCVDPSTQQKLFQTADIPLELRPKVQEVTADGVRLRWENDVAGFPSDHETVISNDFLANVLELQSKVRRDKTEDPNTQVYWDAAQMEKQQNFIDYQRYATTDAGVFEVVDQLWTHGLAFLENIPDDSSLIEKIATRIGPLRNSFYGTTWDVRSVPDSKNIAYTDKFLGLHMDLLYMVNPPRIQVLHSLRARAPGGESMFSDSFLAAESLRKEDLKAFRHLASFPVTYHYDNDGQHYRFTRPTIEFVGNPDVNRMSDEELAVARIATINWSPPFQGPFTVDVGEGGNLKGYLAAAKLFDQSLNSSQNMFEYRLKEGEAVLFDNRRVLHARRSFDAQAGERWLRGVYVDEDVWKSRIRVSQKSVSGN